MVSVKLTRFDWSAQSSLALCQMIFSDLSIVLLVKSSKLSAVFQGQQGFFWNKLYFQWPFRGFPFQEIEISLTLETAERPWQWSYRSTFKVKGLVLWNASTNCIVYKDNGWLYKLSEADLVLPITHAIRYGYKNGITQIVFQTNYVNKFCTFFPNWWLMDIKPGITCC